MGRVEGGDGRGPLNGHRRRRVRRTFVTCAEPSHARKRRLRAAAGALTAPSVFPIEVRHAILKLERRGALPAGTVDASLEQLEAVIEFASPPSEPTVRAAVLVLAREVVLGMYDAVYLHLAIDRGASIASRDGPLLEAARILAS